VHPQFAEAEQAAQTARYRLDLTKRSAREPAQISLGVRRDTAALNGLQSQSLLVGLRVPLGAPARQRWLEAAVQSELDAALIEQERLRERLLREREDARAALESAALQYRLQHERARLLQDRAQLIEKAFRLGENSLPETLRARAAAAVAQAEAARQYAAWGRAQARLETLLGLLP
jgi:outer membrane protein TolC